jgi:hypothetical protein
MLKLILRPANFGFSEILTQKIALYKTLAEIRISAIARSRRFERGAAMVRAGMGRESVPFAKSSNHREVFT